MRRLLSKKKRLHRKFWRLHSRFWRLLRLRGKRTRAEISADADQGNTADNGVGDVGDGDVVTLRPQMS